MRHLFKYYIYITSCVLLSSSSFLLQAQTISKSEADQEMDSLKSLVAHETSPDILIPALSRLSLLSIQTPHELYYLKRTYEEASKVDSMNFVYSSLNNLSRYYYNGMNNRDSLIYWNNVLDSIAKNRNEYPDALFEAKSLSSLDLLWRRNFEMALEEAMAMYQLATEVKQMFGLVCCAENMGLIYQAVRRDKEAIRAFQEGIDLLEEYDMPEKVTIQFRLSSYQAESGLRTDQYALTDSILSNYKRYADAYTNICTSPGEQVYAKREYWLLYSYYANLYSQENKLDKALEALNKASEYKGNIIAEGDYVQYAYLESKALYTYRIGRPQQALHYLDQVLVNERLPENLQLKADILESLGRNKEALALYDEINLLVSRKNNETFLRQINQLQTLHDSFDKKTQAHEMELNQQKLDNRNRQIIFFLSISAVLLIVIYVLFLYYRHARRLKNELQHEKESLLESEDKLKKAKKRAEEASLMKSAFLANMSHEIRTPLNAIVGFSELLVDDSSEAEEKKEYTRIIHNNTELLLNLVNDVLDLSSMETGDMNFELKEYSLMECCQRSLESVRHRIPQGVDLTFTPALKPVLIYTDMLRLQQLLTNLLTNSAKFTERGEINLAYQPESDGTHVRITITDTGCGIPLEKQATIFNRFEKLDDYKPGAGLGLSICMLIAERLKGYLSIDSSYTSGARFIFIHPCEKNSL